jgi:undecaprenol kinase
MSKQTLPRHSLLNAFRCAFRGIFVVLRDRIARIHACIAVLVIVAGLLLRIDRIEWLAVIAAICTVMALEAMNTALERTVDLCMSHNHPIARDAKDIAAGAVLIASIGAAIVGSAIFVPKIMALLS